MIPVLKKIRLFNGLSPSQIRLILSICTSSRFAAGDSVCEVGTPSDGMYILISGELEVLSDADTRLAVIKPVTTVGEMGVVTRQDRSATVRAICDSSALAIGRQSFESILRGDKEMSAVIYRNIVEIMCHKRVQDNDKVRQIQEREWSLEQSLREKNRDLTRVTGGRARRRLLGGAGCCRSAPRVSPAWPRLVPLLFRVSSRSE